jgi:hypothetical protein
LDCNILPSSREEWRCRFKIVSHEECRYLQAPPVLHAWPVNPYPNFCRVTKLRSHRLYVTSTASPPPVVPPPPPSPGDALPHALASPTISSPLPLHWHRPHHLPFLLGVLHGGWRGRTECRPSLEHAMHTIPSILTRSLIRASRFNMVGSSGAP